MTSYKMSPNLTGIKLILIKFSSIWLDAMEMITGNGDDVSRTAQIIKLRP